MRSFLAAVNARRPPRDLAPYFAEDVDFVDTAYYNPIAGRSRPRVARRGRGRAGAARHLPPLLQGGERPVLRVQPPPERGHAPGLLWSLPRSAGQQ